MTDLLSPVMTANWGDPRSWKLNVYETQGGYKALRKALAMPPAEVISTVKDSNLRGRGGAGFPTGMKWGFLPADNPNPRYLVVNADESEPGTCKDIPLMMASPHTLVEGIIIACYAFNAHHAFIYCRGEVLHPIRRLQQAVREAYSAGYAGKNILGTGFDLDITVHAGAGAYICGEETALLSALEGTRGQPRLKPPFPAVAGLYACPTIVNNVETISSVPSIINNGPAWFNAMGTEKSKGMTLYNISGHVNRPGCFEAPMGIKMSELIELAGGIRDGHQLKFFCPGGASAPILTPEDVDVTMDYEGLAARGTMLGSKAIQVFDETTSAVRAALRYMEFFKHESCGKCSPCREGSWWTTQIMQRIERGEGEPGEVDKLIGICDNVAGRSFCLLGDSFAGMLKGYIAKFRDEFEAGCNGTPAWELFPYEKSAIFPVQSGAVKSEGAHA